MTAQEWIDRLALQPHPEGGYFREVYRSAEQHAGEHLPGRFSGDRAYSTAITYLLKEGEFSAFHRIRSDEVWHFYDGGSLEVFVLMRDGDVRCIQLGRGTGQDLLAVVPAGHWFAARCRPGAAYSLCGCTVAPGFDFSDFEMAESKDLVAAFPDQQDLIRELTRA